jgi:6-pyruvoyltetrahydropterin/6-carboxytetrahydropterin synthase
MALSKMTTIELCKEDMKFSAGHFTIFSQTERENFHGHNYQAAVSLTSSVDENGMSFNYRLAKEKIRCICRTLDETFLLPALSPYLKIQKTQTEVTAYFDKETLRFLPRDVICLDVSNITVEALSEWFLKSLMVGEYALPLEEITQIEVKIFSGSGQSGSSMWVCA